MPDSWPDHLVCFTNLDQGVGQVFFAEQARNSHRKGRPDPALALHRNLAAMQFDSFLGDSQAEPGAGNRPCVSGAVKRFKQIVQIGGGNTDPFIAHLEGNFFTAGRKANPNGVPSQSYCHRYTLAVVYRPVGSGIHPGCYGPGCRDPAQQD